MRKRASRLEILGAWFRVWTPPRDVDVPPVPWRKVAVGAGVVALAGVFTALVIAPAIDEGKRERADEARQAEAVRRAAREARLREEQRAQTGRLGRGVSRASAVATVERTIGRDAARRFATDGRAAACDAAPGEDAAAPDVLFDCFVSVRDIVGGAGEGVRGSLAIPYRARVDFPAGRYTFCKVNPRPAEGAIDAGEDVVELPPACRIR